MNGIFNMLKSPGPSSNDLVGDVKRALKKAGCLVNKVGHTGTLDPGAAGVLPVCVGKATRLFEYLVDKDKEYRFELLFGVKTDTLDTFGRIIATDSKFIKKEDLLEVLPKLTGKQIQKPPIYSALKHDGRKLYEIARNDESDIDKEAIREKKAREVNIHKLELLEQTGSNRFLIQMSCSKGTYVRVVCEDIAEKLGTNATMSFLIRNRSGSFLLEDSISLNELVAALDQNTAEAHLISIENALADWPKIEIASKFYKRLCNGNAIDCSQLKLRNSEQMRVYCCGEFFGLGAKKDGEFRMLCNLHEST